MYILIKIVVNAAVILFPAVLLYRDLKHHDRRTRYHRQITHALLLGWIIAGLATIGITWNDYSSSIRSDARISELIQGKDTLVAQNTTLIRQNTELMGQVKTYQVDLEQEKTKTKQLQENAKKAARGITRLYDFKGNLRTTSPGVMGGVFGVNQSKFDTIMQLNDKQQWQELARYCDKVIQEVPEWYTPYLYGGLGYANSKNFVKGIQYLETVVENTAGDPQYADAVRLLNEMRRANQALQPTR